MGGEPVLDRGPTCSMTEPAPFDYSASEPKKKGGTPMPFENLPRELEFAGVALHSSAPRVFELINSGKQPNKVSLAVVGKDLSAFVVDAEVPLTVSPKTAGATPTVGVRFVPHSEGVFDAVLLINHETGQQHVVLKGRAIAGDGKHTPRSDEKPAVSPLSPVDSMRPDTLTGKLREASRHVAEVNERHNAVTPRIDSALAAIEANGQKAIDSLDRKVKKWLSDEGVAAVDGTEFRSPAAKNVERGAWVFDKVIEHVLGEESTLVGPVGIAAKVSEKILGFALEKREENIQEDKREDGKESISQASKQAGSSHPGPIASYMTSLAGSLSRHAGALNSISAVKIPGLFGRLASAIASAEQGSTEVGYMVYDEAEKVVGDYIGTEGLMWPHLANAELFAATINPRCDAGFQLLLDQYIVERSKQSEPRQTPGMVDEPGLGRVQLHVDGELDLSQEQPIRLEALTIDGLGSVSTTVWEHIASKKLTELPAGCDVTFELRGAPPIERVVFDWVHGALSMRMLSARGMELLGDDARERMRASLMNLAVGDRISK